jgi:nucleoside-diphosphate-sugar epimerase
MATLRPFREWKDDEICNFPNLSFLSGDIPAKGTLVKIIKPKMKILVTGAAGFVGTSIIEILLARANELGIEKIVGLDNLMFKEEAVIPLLRNPKFELVIGDVRDRELLTKLCQEADVIYPLAALVGAPICAQFPKEAWEINREHIKTIVDAIKGRETKLLYPCTNSIYGNSGGTVDEDTPKRCISIYAQSKFEGEKLVLDAGGVSLRLATLAGVSYRQRKDLLVNTMCLKALTDKYVLLYEPNFQRCYISAGDAARAFVYALENYSLFQGEPFNCGNTALNSSKLELATKVKEYVPGFVIKVEDYLKDPDQRDYRVKNDKLEATGFKCQEDFDVIIPQVLKSYKVLLEVSNFFTT